MNDMERPTRKQAIEFGLTELKVLTNMVEIGVMGLGQIHSFTNRMVDQDGELLSKKLEDPDVLRTYVLALFVELGELIQELDWKPWRGREKAVDMTKVAEEFADILAFIGVLITILEARGVPVEKLAVAYEQKELVNINRFLDAAAARQGKYADSLENGHE